MEAKHKITEDMENKLFERYLAVKENYTLEAKNGWTSEKELKRMTVYSRNDKTTNSKWIRGQGVIPCSVAEAIELIKDDAIRKSIDNSCEETYTISKQKDHLLMYASSKKPGMFVSARDCIVLASVFTEDDGTAFFVGTSVETPDLPDKSGFVRAEIILVAWIFSPNKEDPKKTDVVYIISNDPKGWIPTALSDKFNLVQAVQVVHLEKYITKKSTEGGN